ncbi:MAG: FAD-binding oxidoreductase [Acidobacteria bacterium]|nr:FAD-binding oxidoreductase [Acidobacteriota bacterium]
MADPLWQKSLEQILGPQNVRFDPDAIRQRAWAGVPPRAIATPNSREQVCELLRMANADRLKVIPFGHGTKLLLGGVPQPVDFAISLERLNKICDYPANDLTISVEAGVPIRELESTLAGKGQMLPLDVPFAGQATVGGTIATNMNGPRRLGYGAWRDILLGVQFATADGKLAKGGGKVVKNVAGYDTPKLMIGALGSLGILLEFTFKVFPKPPASTTIALHFRSGESVSRAALRIVHSPLLPQALELMDAPAGALANQPELQLARFTLLAGVAGLEEVLTRFEHGLPALVRADGLEHFEILRGKREAEVWNAVQELTPEFLSAHPRGIVVKASLPLSRLGDFICDARTTAEEYGLSQATLARTGSGIVYAYLWPKSREPEDSIGELLRQAAERMIREAEQGGGRAIVEWCPAELKNKINLWGTLGDDFASMRQLKAALDPQGTLSPGRFYGGI